LIVVDTSALIAIALSEPQGPSCRRVLSDAELVLISAATMLEAYIVAARRGFLPQMEDLLDGFGVEVVSVTADSAIRAAEAYRRFGKGFHPAKLNFGDCFAYELARSRDCPLLYVGEDFARTDVRGAITAAP
jgi:ribonuclease VapC